MATPQQIPPQNGPRRSSRRQKPAQFTETSDMTLTSSDNDSPIKFQRAQAATGQATPQKPREPKSTKKTHVVKRESDVSQPVDISVKQRRPQSVIAAQVEKTKATPIKQAYAGPTFHHSPAPSALPIPSFYSRSVPTSKTVDPRETIADQNGAENSTRNEPSDPTPATEHEPGKRESTPLDFLFEAARQARGTPRAESPSARSLNLSTLGDSPRDKSPAPREGDPVFPIELEGSGNNSDIGATSVTPFRDRIEALRPTSSPANSVGLDEHERKAKTEALKKLLMNSHQLSHRPASASPHPADPNNPFNARAPQPRSLHHPSPQLRHHSGPSTPAPPYTPHSALQSSQYFPPMPLLPNNVQSHEPLMHRPPSSHLRHAYQPNNYHHPAELSSDNGPDGSLISTSRKQTLRNQTPRKTYGDPSGQLANESRRGHKPTPSTQQLEDDLRRILKLDLSTPS